MARFIHHHEMTDEWKSEVRAALAQRGVHEQWLADQVGARRDAPGSMKRDTINKLLRKQHTSTLVPEICAILGISPPMIPTAAAPDEDSRKINYLLLGSPPWIKHAVRGVLERWKQIYDW